MLNEQAFNAPNLLNNRLLFDKISGWKTFIAIFFCFNLFQALIESYIDYNVFLAYDSQVQRAQDFYQGVEFVNAKYLFNFIVFRELSRGFALASCVLPDGVLLAQIEEPSVL